MVGFMVVWSGGYEAPSYQVLNTEQEAWDKSAEYIPDMQDGDTIDVLRIDMAKKTVERLEQR